MSNLFSSVRSRLILLILAAVLPAFGLILYSARKHHELTANQVKLSASMAARVIASEQDRVLDNAHQFLVTLARLPQVRGNDRNACHRILSGLLEPRYADLMVADRNGKPLCTALKTGSSLATSRGLHHRRSVETYDFSVGHIRYHPGSKKILLDVSYPVMASPGVLRGVVSAAVDLSWINHITVDNHLYPGATFSLVNADGIVLLRYPGGLDWVGKPVVLDGIDSKIVARDAAETVELTAADGVRRLFAFSPLKNSVGRQPVYAAIDLPAALAFVETKEILIATLVALGIFSAIILSLAWRGADLFVLRRIKDVINATHKVAGGNLRARTTLAYDNSELGQMAKAFDNLAQALESRKVEADESAKQIQQHAIELEKSNKIKDEFLGVMSHELRTPLNIMMNYAEALKMGAFGKLKPEQIRGTDKIRAQGRELLLLINGILEIAKIESHTVSLQNDAVNLMDFISEIKSDYSCPMEKDVGLVWNYSDLPLMLTDGTKLKHILTNLINNAIKFTECGSVAVSISAKPDHTLELTVADTGPGIPADLLPFVFDKFRQADSATTRTHSGAGLGLFIVKNFVDMLGGTIEVSSKVGEGSVFTVRLPIQLAGERIAPASGTEPAIDCEL